MEQMKASHCFTEMADALEISKSGFFAHQRKEECPRAQQDKELLGAIESLFVASRRTYGSPRIMHALRRRGWLLRQKSHRPAHALTRSARQAKTAV